MTANAVLGSPTMGAIFGGMFLSGKKATQVVMKLLKEG
jgi:thiamine thiazole synthase